MTQRKRIAPSFNNRDKVLQHLEKQLGLTLPRIYREFMLDPSLLAQDRLTGTAWGIGELVELQQDARELLDENRNPFELREQDFVFRMHQGYQFDFFPCDQGEDPPVYFYTEGNESAPENPYDRISDWIDRLERA